MPLGGVAPVQVRVVVDQPWDVKADVLVVPILGQPDFAGPLGELDKRAGGELKSLADFGEIPGKRFKSVLASAGEAGAGRLLAVSAGDAATLDRETVVKLGASAERRLAGRTVHSLAIWISPLAGARRRRARRSRSSWRAASWRAATTRPRIYREGYTDGPPKLDELILVAPGEDAARLAKAAERGVIMGEGANIARTLSNRSSNDVSPEVLAEEAWSLAEKHDLWIDVIGPEKATEMGMGLFMAVGRGSDNPPRMIVMRSGRAGEKDALGRHLAIVGKGVCFDSGGISIKPSDRMEEMKMDKTGRGHGHRGRRHGRPARAGHPAPHPRADGREHARPALDPAG